MNLDTTEHINKEIIEHFANIYADLCIILNIEIENYQKE